MRSGQGQVSVSTITCHIQAVLLTKKKHFVFLQENEVIVVLLVAGKKNTFLRVATCTKLASKLLFLSVESAVLGDYPSKLASKPLSLLVTVHPS